MSIYTISQVAEMLKISLSTLDREVKRGNIPRVKIGNKVLFMKEDVKNYLEKHREVLNANNVT